MKKRVPFIFLFLFSWFAILGQTAPDHIQYFGFALVDCLWDDPMDNSTITNYTEEISTFSNVAHMCVFDINDDLSSRVGIMIDNCVKPIVHIQPIFYEGVLDASTGSGVRYDLLANYQDRWNVFKSNNMDVLNTASIEAFYVVDEPVWNGLSYVNLEVVCDLIKSDFPNIPLMIVEAWPVINDLQVPTSIDWLAFDKYAVFDPSTDAEYLSDLESLKLKRTTDTQQIFLIVDDQWLPYYGVAGFPPDTIAYMVQNYYELAVSDTSIVGLLGYLWPGGLDDSQQLGVRNLPQNVIDKNIEIGQMIKANYSPCDPSYIYPIPYDKVLSHVSPNPTDHSITIALDVQNIHSYDIVLVNDVGGIVFQKTHHTDDEIVIPTQNLPSGMYFYHLYNSSGHFASGKVMVHE